MFQERFSSWARWPDRTGLQDLHYPGVYIITRTDSPLTGQFSWRNEIIYIGMTNAIGGLRSRLNQFDETLRGRIKHGGADRVLNKYRDYNLLHPQLSVSVCAIPCNVRSSQPVDLRLMGEVCRLEFICFAEYVERYGRLPEFNDKELSPKFSLSRAS